MPGDTNSVTRLAMMRAILASRQDAGGASRAAFTLEHLAEIIERESGFRELYESLERLLCLVLTGWGYCVETAEELGKYPEIDYPPIVAARAALAKVRGKQ